MDTMSPSVSSIRPNPPSSRQVPAGCFVGNDGSSGTSPHVRVGWTIGIEGHLAVPPKPPGIRVAYHGGSTGLSWGRDMESGETERVEVVVAQGLLDRRVS
jgi:hypothetical protein